MQDVQKKDFLLHAAYFAVLLALGYLTARFIFWWLLPFLIALAIAAALEPVILFLGRTLHFKRSFSAAVLTLFLLFLLGGLLSLLLSTLFAEANSALAQVPALLDALPTLTSSLLARLEPYSELCPDWLRSYFSSQLSELAVQGGAALGNLASRLLSRLGALAAALPRFALSAATTVLAVYFTAASYPTLCRAARERMSERMLRRVRLWRSGATRSIARWLRAQSILFLLTFLQLLAGFFLLGEPFALLAAFLTTLVDALPVFGTGTVLIPWAFGEILFGNTPRAIALLALYLCTLLVRNITEPKLMAAQAGLPPIASLLAMYLGFCTFGVAGMILFPFLLLLMMQIRRTKKESAA